ncbi:MAG: YgiT-type zinc finger protein [Anaerolineales bacterium]
MKDQGNSKAVYRCAECPVGIRRLRYLTYFTWFRDQFITVPNFPAWVCDICGRREYDVRAISWLNTLLSSSHNSHSSADQHSAYT